MQSFFRLLNLRRASFQLAFPLLIGTTIAAAFGQETKPQPPANANTSTPTQAKAAVAPNLTARYRLAERFTVKDDPGLSGAVGQYEVSFWEQKQVVGSQQPFSREFRYTERPAVLSPASDQVVTDSVRHYQYAKLLPEPEKPRTDRKPLEDLEIWYREKLNQAPDVIVLSKDRRLSNEEYLLTIDYDSVTKFAFLLPETPVRIGDSWNVVHHGAGSLINEPDIARGRSLTAMLSDMAPHPRDNQKLLATITVKGKLDLESKTSTGEVTVNAEIKFGFRPVSNAVGDAVDGYGVIEQIKLGQNRLEILRDNAGERTVERKVVFYRKLRTTEPLLKIPNPVPSATPENSWLTYVDKNNRFYFRHPQALSPDTSQGESTVIYLLHFHTNSFPDIVSFDFHSEQETQPEKIFQVWKDEWRDKKMKVISNPIETLPPAAWPDFSVQHMEAVVQSENDPSLARRYFDGFLLLFKGEKGDMSMIVTANTSQDQPASFRKDVEGILKSLKFGALPK